MPPRSLLRPSIASAVLALASTSALVANASSPPVPPVAEIPIAPATAPKKKAGPPDAKTATTVVTTTTTTTVPALAALAVEPAASRHGDVTELMPVVPAPTAISHVVLVDELPFRATHARARELPEHAHHGKKKGRHGRPFHPAPGIVVEVNEASGAASADDLQRNARNVGYWPFRHCYEEGLRRDQNIGGKVTLDLATAPGGAGQSANVTGATLHDESVVLCVAREAAHLSLAAETPGSAKMEVTLSTGDEPVPVPHAVPHADELREALRASWPAVKQCYTSEIAKHADTGGRMELRFRMRPGGEIAEVAENGETRFADVDVTRCVLGVYRGAKLPSIAHETSFVYAIHLEARP